MGNSIKPHIQNAQKTGVCQLCNSGLNEIPKELLQLHSVLRTIDISDNKISHIPGSIGKFASLKHFTMNNNRLSRLPEEFGNLKKLETLSLNGNNLTTLPNSFSQLTNLRNVSLSDNNFTQFLPVFNNFSHLEVLNLSHNKITTVPDHVQNLSVTELNLNQNQITVLSEAVAECPRLKVLRLEENCLQLPAISDKILADSQISLFAVDGNLFEMKELHALESYEKYMERYTATKKKLY